ncbi:hypothetical protein TWF696_002886 [Orbilia brochopaga]|uniref:Homeobox domain-containing protein n=1 Tax=Orbilia brochopaga TaxID=3140254 RepID=A0AAV9U0G2_9PEZI
MASTSTSSPATTQTFAFITHSPATLPNNLPPDVDDAKLARRRRRRTSMKDQAILEAEYAKNDRPDKSTRREIADRIGLEEKQVQIWFQNRRQTNRRKSKPLRAHEILPRNGTKCLDLSSDPFISSPYNPKTDTAEIPSPSSRASSPCPAVEPLVKTEVDVQQPRDTEVHMSDATEPDVSIGVSITSSSLSTSLEQPDIARKTSPIHFLLNPASETPDTSFQSTVADEPEFSQQTSIEKTAVEIQALSPTPLQNYVNPRRTGLIADTTPKLLKRSSSQVRLSMSFDGKATIVLEDDEETIASPRSSQTSASTLVESSQSTLNEATCTPPKRRTLDAKIWESCCDSQSSLPKEPVKEDSPRKALKAIRARGVVAAAKAAADARKQRAATTTITGEQPTKKKALAPKSTNGTVSSTITTPAAKKAKIQRSSPTKKDKPRKVVTATHKGPKKATPSPPLSAVKNQKRSPFRGLEKTVNGGNGKGKPGFTIYQSSDEGDSEKENWDPTSKTRKSRGQQQPSWRSKGGRSILEDLAGERVPQPNELEVIENLMSLRDGLWR